MTTELFCPCSTHTSQTGESIDHPPSQPQHSKHKTLHLDLLRTGGTSQARFGSEKKQARVFNPSQIKDIARILPLHKPGMQPHVVYMCVHTP